MLIWLTLMTTALAPVFALAQEWRTHTVARGENLTVIAQQYGVTVQDLRVWNDLHSDRLLVGNHLRIPAEDQEWYVVRRGDNLTDIATHHHTTVAMLRHLNGLNGSVIHPGQKLKLRPAPADEAIHVVRPGENLSLIATRRGLSVNRLKSINSLSSDTIIPGQKLRLREVGITMHMVERGDALWEIARAYDLTIAELIRLNGLTSDRIYPGQELKVSVTNTAPQLAEYVVKPGDNLTEIAQLHQMSLRELRDVNTIRGSLIQPGQKLKVRPMLGGAVSTENAPTDWASLTTAISGVRFFESSNGPYYHGGPRAAYQTGANYAEDCRLTPNTAYKRARQLWEHFEGAVDRLPPLSQRLAGWHFVIDPGHGGIDPGAIVAGKDRDGSTFYVVEDEYAYDLSLRVAVLLKLHGADVTPTILSSNHLLRESSPASATFVHDRSEVFNDEAWNRSRHPRTWPKGNQRYHDQRIAIAKRAVIGVPESRQVFLSFHADNDPSAGDAVTLFYHQSSQSIDTRSREFARSLLSAMGAGARMKGRNLAMLRGNPLRYKLLVEMRNLAFEDHVWSIRYEQLRQRDAEKVVTAVLDGLVPGTGGAMLTASP